MGHEDAALRGIGQIALTVDDLTRSRAFYGEALGLEHLFDAPGMSFFDCGEGVRLLLGEPEGEDAELHGAGAVLYFRVGDIRAAHDELRERRVEFEREPHLLHRGENHELWMAFFRDPDGHLLALMSEMPTE